MLTEDYIEKVVTLMDQTGEPRPGYLHDEQDNFEGAIASSCISARENGSGYARGVRVAFRYEVSDSGAITLVQE